MSLSEYLILLKKRRQFYQALIEQLPLEQEAIEKKELYHINLLLTQKKILLNCIEDVEKKIVPFHKAENLKEGGGDRKILHELHLTKNLIRQLLNVNNHHQKALEHGSRPEQRPSTSQVHRDPK